MGRRGEFGADGWRGWVYSIIPILGAPPSSLPYKQSEGLSVDTRFLNINLRHLQTKGASGV